MWQGAGSGVGLGEAAGAGGGRNMDGRVDEWLGRRWEH